MSAPCGGQLQAVLDRRLRLRTSRPPSENESGVTFTTPMTRQRSALGSARGAETAAAGVTGGGAGDWRRRPRPSLRASRRSWSRGQTRNASASRAAIAIRGASLVPGKTKNRGCHSGQNLALNLYRDSIWNHLDAKISTDAPGPQHRQAPIRSPRSRAARKTAKFSEIRLMPEAGAALMVSTIGSRSARAGRSGPAA